MYYKNENGIVYLDDPESPNAVYSSDEWIVERERLITGIQSQINAIQAEIDNIGEPIEILDTYPQNVKDLIEQNNEEMPSTDDLEIEKQIKIDLKNHITNL